MMCEYGIIINEFNIWDNHLKVSANITADKSSSIRLKINFRCGNEIRRLPVPQDENGDFSYIYLLDKIFVNMKGKENISVSFDVIVDGDTVENASFSFVNHLSSDSRKFGRKVLTFLKYVYSYSHDEENNSFIISVEKNHDYFLMLSVIISKIVFGIIAFILSCFVLAIGCIKELPSLRESLKVYLRNIKTYVAVFLRKIYKDDDVTARVISAFEKNDKKFYKKCCKMPIVPNRITFVSGRRDEIGGNEKFVYDLIKDRDDLDIHLLMSSSLNRQSPQEEKNKFFELYATSKVVIVDDHFTLLDSVSKREGVTLFQLWHACGAFKTFGFSRLGKPGGPIQTAPSHRMYDFATVSSDNIIKNYAEGFGVSDSNIIATGIPRTDIFFDDIYAENVRNKFYDRFPQLKNKKIALFAPTFRGNGKETAFYPTENFSPDDFYEKTDGKYALLIKMHPFCKERFYISDKYKDYIIDLSEEDELNDLLFVTDLLITDYSSSVFEASLLNIPMLFYAFDLEEYIAERDFYSDFVSFVPGKIVKTDSELIDAVNAGSFDIMKVEPFKHIYFNDCDGKSSERVRDAILKALEL